MEPGTPRCKTGDWQPQAWCSFPFRIHCLCYSYISKLTLKSTVLLFGNVLILHCLLFVANISRNAWFFTSHTRSVYISLTNKTSVSSKLLRNLLYFHPPNVMKVRKVNHAGLQLASCLYSYVYKLGVLKPGTGFTIFYLVSHFSSFLISKFRIPCFPRVSVNNCVTMGPSVFIKN